MKGEVFVVEAVHLLDDQDSEDLLGRHTLATLVRADVGVEQVGVNEVSALGHLVEDVTDSLEITGMGVSDSGRNERKLSEKGFAHGLIYLVFS